MRWSPVAVVVRAHRVAARDRLPWREAANIFGRPSPPPGRSPALFAEEACSSDAKTRGQLLRRCQSRRMTALASTPCCSCRQGPCRGLCLEVLPRPLHVCCDWERLVSHSAKRWGTSPCCYVLLYQNTPMSKGPAFTTSFCHLRFLFPSWPLLPGSA